MSAAVKALVAAQKAMGAVIKNTTNPHLRSRYADLGAVLDACQTALHANGFAIVQPCGKDHHGAFVDTVLAHESGESLSSRVYLVIGKNDMQGVGSAITYARRYGLLGMTGLAPEDDDGEATKAPKPAPRQASEPTRAQTQERDPQAIADGLISAFGKATTADGLHAFAAEGTKAAQAWDWLEVEAKDYAARVKAAFDARLIELQQKDIAA